MVDREALDGILRDLADVDNHVESIAARTPTDSDLNIRAYAIHHLAQDLRALIDAID